MATAANAMARLAMVVATLVLTCTATHAQDHYPSKPVRIVVSFAAGGPTDIVARVMGAKMGDLLGQQFVVENKAGAGGNTGADMAAKSAPDGYTLLMATVSTHAINPGLYSKMPYDPVRDFTPVGQVGVTPTLLAVHPSLAATDVASLIALVKANPGHYAYGSSGVGSILHLCGEQFKAGAGGLDIVHVPYKGIGQGVTDLIGGQIPMFSANATAQILDLHRAGKVRILSVNSQTRIRSAPDIPTSIEAGLPGMVAQTTFGIFAPAGTPKPILERINAVTQEAMADEAFQKELLRVGFEPVRDVGPDKAAGVFQQELVRWTPILKTVSMKPQ